MITDTTRDPFRSFHRSLLPLALAAAWTTAAGSTAAAQTPADVDAAAARLEALKAGGVKTKLLLHPVHVLGRADANIADVLGLVLERRGCSDLQIAAEPFVVGDTKWDDVPRKFAAHVRAREPREAGRYCVYAQFLGDPKQGPTEVRFVVTDADGGVVIVDRQQKGDPDFARTAGRDPDPLGCSNLVADRLLALASWTPTPGGVPDGAFAQKWRDKAGAPDAAQLAAMAERLRTLRDKLPKATFTVWPTIATAPGASDVARLQQALRTELGCGEVAARAKPALDLRATSNQQRRLWDLAKALRAAVREQAIATDYAVAIDLGLDPDGGRGFVDVVVVDQRGDAVIAEMQNDQSNEFGKKRPATVAAGEDLAITRLRALLR